MFIALSAMTLGLYLLAMIMSLCGSDYFLLSYQNAQMDSIESWLRGYGIYGLVNMLFSVIEFVIILGFMLRKFPNPLYALAFYGIQVGLAFIHMPSIAYTLYPFAFYLAIPLIDQLICCRKIDWKAYGKALLRLLMTVPVTMVLQVMIHVIKTGSWAFQYVNSGVAITSSNISLDVEYLD